MLDVLSARSELVILEMQIRFKHFILLFMVIAGYTRIEQMSMGSLELNKKLLMWNKIEI